MAPVKKSCFVYSGFNIVMSLIFMQYRNVRSFHVYKGTCPWDTMTLNTVLTIIICDATVSGLV
jgi:hypothetical protein